jgi:(1->4)-alpha-D-glucan 1-alpha-D-glucosylmutase
MATPPTRGSASVPTASYRLQFGLGFGFREAEAIVPYLDALGISHVYASPILKARRGSTHGYDITDHNALNDELGDERAFDEFVATLHRHGMGLILDFVPNHMGIGRADNQWWLDVLEWGRASPYADYFDIDWQPEKRELRGKVLLPFLGDHYGAVLEAGELALRFDADTGTFSVWYHEHRFSVAPHLYSRILAVGLDESRHREASGVAVVEALIVEFRALQRTRMPASGRLAARTAAEGLKQQLHDAYRNDGSVRDHIERCLGYFNGALGQATTFLPLHRLLELQHYRLAYWKVAADEINYRRFFDINELAALRMETRELFDTAHRLILRWITEGKVQGLRFDHVDGLFNPRAYFRAVQEEVSRSFEGGDGSGGRPFYLLVEKILAAHERLRDNWPVAGTTGYEFVNLLNGVFVDPSAERAMDRIYRRFTGETRSFDDILRDSKLRVMDTALSGELTVLARELDRISESNWHSRDFTLDGLREALRQVVADLPIYRTYVEDRHVHAVDRQEIATAVMRARTRNSDIDPGQFDFIGDVLTTDLVRRPRSGYGRRQVVRFAMKFQQYTGPVMAKSMEDTAFYRYNRLVSLNEVGGEPRAFGTEVEAFHRANLERQHSFPHSMLATSTHDTKRGEDVRTRIDVLSEISDEWETQVNHWSRLNRSSKSEIDGRSVPTANDEYLLYQTLVGAWPTEIMDIVPAPSANLDAFRGRIDAFMVKALRESKTHSSWANPNVEYERAMSDFIGRLLDTTKPNSFLESFLPFQATVAWFGMLNGISQTALKILAPGVPDIYQGAESWCLSLVDPDNRHPVPFAALSEELRASSVVPDAAAKSHSLVVEKLLHGWKDGRVKIWLSRILLRLRRHNPRLFGEGDYFSAVCTGTHAVHICAFARRHGGEVAIVIAPRLMARLVGPELKLPVGQAVWQDTCLSLPWDGCSTELIDVVTGRPHSLTVRNGRASLPVSVLLQDFPVAVLAASLVFE